MSNQFSSGRAALGFCDICSFRFPLHELKALVIKHKVTNIMACPVCFDLDHPQLFVGELPVEDPQAVRNPRPDPSMTDSRTLTNQVAISTLFFP